MLLGLAMQMDSTAFWIAPWPKTSAYPTVYAKLYEKRWKK
jgi:hypothetical protein